ncbi:MAG: GNAT family N-acetyltransferase [Bacteroidetes bacterium]|nr:GNAT family N-acetyltransferase [Bacteroidota bacterium]
MKIIAETERLILREMTPDDAESAYWLNLDPECLQFTGDSPFTSIEEARAFLIKYDHYNKYGFGRWAVIRKSDREYLGWCGLKYTEDKNEFDVGYRLMKKFWNQGYATEAAAKSVELGFSKFGMNEIVGRAMKENLASIQVLKKIGMQYQYDFILDNQLWELYSATKS